MRDLVTQYDVFLSYNWRDHEAVGVIEPHLLSQGLTVFLDRWYLVPGRPWPQALEEILHTCRAVAIFLGPNGMGPWQQREKDLALNRQARNPSFPVIPVLLPGADPALGFLALNTWVDLRDGLDALPSLAVLDAAVRGEPPGPELQGQIQATLATVCPYRGLRPFREEDASFYFGREASTSRLVTAVDLQTLVAVVGASGSGKSSVVMAGLVPHLRRKRTGQVWDVVTLVPGERPLHALAAALVPLLEPEMSEVDRLAEVGKLAGYLAEGYVALGDVVARALQKQSGTDRLLLVVDQWEELYTLGRDERVRRKFLDGVLEATDRGQLSVVLTLRADFYGHALSYRPLADRLGGTVVNLGPMTREEQELAVKAPAQKVALTFEEGLVNRILDDVEREPGSLPLMEFVLTGLWERRCGGQLRHEVYEIMGEVKGVVAHRAEEVFARLTPLEQEEARQVFLQLVRPGEDTEDTRRRATLAEMTETARPVVQRLADTRLLVTGRDAATGDETIEVAHEALIRHWTRLRMWLNGDREFLLWRQWLRSTLGEWVRSNHNDDILLRGVLLTEAERWLAERLEDLSLAERGFIQESLAVWKRRRRWWFAAVTMGVAVLIALSALAWMQRNEALYQAELAKDAREEAETQRDKAEEQGRIALARQLAAQAELVRNQRVDLLPRSMLLAIESMRRYPSLEGDQVLRRGLALLPRPLVHLVHEGDIRTLVFSPAGQWLATGSADRMARVWDVATGREIVRIRHAIDVQALAFSADGRLLMTADQDDVRLWKADTGVQVAHRRQQSRPTTIVLSRKGEWLATQGYGRTARVWEPRTGRELLTVPFDEDIEAAALSPDGRYLAAAGLRRTRMWEVTSGRELPPIYQGVRWGNLTFNPSGQWLAMGTSDRTVRVWQVGSGSEVRQIWCEGCEDLPIARAFSPNSQWLAINADRTLQVREVGTNTEVVRVVPGLAPVAFSPNGRSLTTWTGDNTITIWEITPEPEMAQLPWEIASEPEKAERIGVSAVAFAPDGTWLASGWGGRKVQVWEATTGRTRAQVQRPGGAELRVSLGSHGQWLATVDDRGTLQVWEVDTGQRMSSLAPEDPVQAISFSRDGTRLAIASGNRVRVREVATGQLEAEVPHKGEVWAVAFSPDGRRLATASTDHAVRVCEVATRRVVASMAHEDAGMVRAIAFSPDGKWLATGSSDKTARLWEASTGRAFARMQHESDVEAVAVSPDGKWLVTASGGQGWRWLLQPQDLIAEACARLIRNLTPQEWQQYLSEEPYRKTCPKLP